LCCSPVFFYYCQVSFKLSFNSAKEVFLGHQQCACIFCVHHFRVLLCFHHQMSCILWSHVVCIHHSMLSEFFVLFPNCACKCNTCQSHSSNQLLMIEAETVGYEQHTCMVVHGRILQLHMPYLPEYRMTTPVR